ncbi:ABC transporter permease [Paraliomyxa miuraensis]|uniref:ABC transporter permease n=1 Tax=Paraliomyxa miuraensis TaxID=376150 RepID=UPI002256E738|nr:ABC transporter permease [Paraliomyxa miuraensis]MCX4243610.1 ABC transporter permease [Paraliomyxa miuraensis]
MTLVGLSVKNIRRNRLRAVLTVLGVAIALLAFVFIRTTLDAWSTGAEHAAQDRLGTMHKVSFTMDLPRTYFEELDGTRGTVPGVKAATYQNWFGGKHPVREQEFFATIAVHSDTFFDVYSDMAVPPDQLAAWKEDRQGAIVGEALAKQFGWSVGDDVTLLGTIYPGDWKFTIRGIYSATRRAVDRTQFVFHWTYLNESIKDTMPEQTERVGWISTVIEPGARGADVAQAIDAKFEEHDVQTRTMSERALSMEFMGSFGAILTALDVVSGVILVIMMLILGNTIAMSVRERTNEHGVLLALGFRPKHIALFVMGEGLAIGLLGGLAGLCLSYPFINGMGRWIEDNMGAWFPYFQIPIDVAITALLLAMLLAGLAAVIPAYRASRLDVIDALRRIG